MTSEQTADVLVVGGGPAGSTLAWALARSGVDVLVLERTRFPREKVCGDYVDPRGLRILEAMGCLDELDRFRSPPIDHTAIFVGSKCCFRGPIPFYGLREDLAPHGYTVPRAQLDAAMLGAAVRAGAVVHDQSTLGELRTGPDGVTATARRSGTHTRYRAHLVAGADGANSLVARSQGMSGADPRFTVIAQRAYAAVAPTDSPAENEIYFDESTFPGYAWMFPGRDGVANLGVGVLTEARERFGMHVPSLFSAFVEQLRRHHPGCAEMELVSKPIGGVVRTYGGHGCNYFDGGVLVGDAGGFADPMTGEGITQGMESALLAAPVLQAALRAGSFGARQLSPYETAFREFFDPALTFLDFCAAIMRNRHLARLWLSAMSRGCEVAQGDPKFARSCSTFFGGLEIRPLEIVGEMWARIFEEALLAWPRLLGAARSETRDSDRISLTDLAEWQTAFMRSMVSDPVWHVQWSIDTQRRWGTVLEIAASGERDRRVEGLLAV